MSLSWRNRISVFLSPHRVELVRLQRRVKPGRAERQVAACERADERGIVTRVVTYLVKHGAGEQVVGGNA